MENKKEVSIRTINKTDIRFLFELLKERDSRANISHKKMPTFTEHKNFVNSKPYSKWYVILYENERVGSIYLSKNNEIGIFILRKFQEKNIGKFALEKIMKNNPRKRYLANVNPKNKKSINFFMKNDFKLIQYTFEFE
ncbi:MAG: N-acetyltransferase [Chloroflexi bacterium]|nr:N-acetyltransferase [Chloroflexota bacterium]|tara:strand:- start:43620 stop:44033 length:414 start_codon:yes stop_codon:yes gene_type:complete